MKHKWTRVFLGLGGSAALLLALATPALAQYRPQPLNDPATGESFHIEAGVAFWNPSADLVFASGGSGALSGIRGTDISAKDDLGFVDKRLPSFQVMLRPGAAHKLRFQYTPIKYDATATTPRNIDFNGIRYPAGLSVTSALDWKAYRFGYEFDFVRRPQGFAGFITELKYTDVSLSLVSTGRSEFFQKRAPIPAIGGIGRVYLVPNLSASGEVTFFKLPTIEDRYAGHYVDMDFYGTLNFSSNVGVQGGWRSMNLGYLIKEDTGSFKMNGIYFGVVARY